MDLEKKWLPVYYLIRFNTWMFKKHFYLKFNQKISSLLRGSSHCYTGSSWFPGRRVGAAHSVPSVHTGLSITAEDTS